MGFFSYTVAGVGFILIGAYESLVAIRDPNPVPGTDPSSPVSGTKLSRPKSDPPSSLSSPFSSIAAAGFSSLFIINSLISFFTTGNSDRVGAVMQLQAFGLPTSIINLVLLFGFLEEFLLFYLQNKDLSGIENRYYDLMLVPILISLFCTVLELKSPNYYTTVGRGIGLVLQGTWFLQMGVSFFTGLMANGCSFREKSGGNFTIRCKGHAEYHRARAIATLQFNCHLALMVVLAVASFSVVANKYGYSHRDISKYRPLEVHMQQMENSGTFTLDSDEEDEIREERNVIKKENNAVLEMSVNGFGSHD